MECVPVYAFKMNTLLPGPTFWIFLIVSRLTKTIVRRIEYQIMDLIEESLFTHLNHWKFRLQYLQCFIVLLFLTTIYEEMVRVFWFWDKGWSEEHSLVCHEATVKDDQVVDAIIMATSNENASLSYFQNSNHTSIFSVSLSQTSPEVRMKLAWQSRCVDCLTLQYMSLCLCMSVQCEVRCVDQVLVLGQRVQQNQIGLSMSVVTLLLDD